MRGGGSSTTQLTSRGRPFESSIMVLAHLAGLAREAGVEREQPHRSPAVPQIVDLYQCRIAVSATAAQGLCFKPHTKPEFGTGKYFGRIVCQGSTFVSRQDDGGASDTTFVKIHSATGLTLRYGLSF